MGIFPQCKEINKPPRHLSQTVDVIILSAVELGSIIVQYCMLFLVV